MSKQKINKNITIKNIKLQKESNRKSIKEVFSNYNGNYKKENIDWGIPLGREIW